MINKKGLILILFLVGIVSCSQNQTVTDYESKLKTVSTLLDEQYQITSQIADNFQNPEIHKEVVDDYIQWLESNRNDLEDFKLFVEENYKELEREGKNPVVIRDFVKIMLDEQEYEEDFFERCNAIYERYNR